MLMQVLEKYYINGQQTVSNLLLKSQNLNGENKTFQSKKNVKPEIFNRLKLGKN